MDPKIPSVTYFDDRFYLVEKGGVKHYIPSVTTKLAIEAKPFLYRYYAELGWDQARKKLHEAGDRGTRIHYAMYIYLMGGAVIFNPWNSPKFTDDEIQKIKTEKNGLITILSNQDEMVAAWKIQQFFDRVKPKIKHLEMTVYSIEDDIAGTLDAALEIEKGVYDVSGLKGLTIPSSGIWIVDLKTGNQVSESAWAQIAPYSVAYERMGLGETQGGLILHTSASTKKGIPGFSAETRTAKELVFHYEIYKHLSAVFDARNPNLGPIAFEFPSIIQRIL